MQIRKAELTDLGKINQLMQNSEAYRGEYFAMLDGYAITPSHLDQDLFYLAEDNNVLLGFYSLILDPPELDHLFVANEAQGLGIGAALFKHLRELLVTHHIKNLKIISHPPALEFYKKMGAKQVGWQEAKGKITWRRPVLEFIQS